MSTLKLYCLEFSNVSNNHVWNIWFSLSYYLCFRGSLVNKIGIVFFLVENIRALNIVNNIRLSSVEYFSSFSPPEENEKLLLCWVFLLSEYISPDQLVEPGGVCGGHRGVGSQPWPLVKPPSDKDNWPGLAGLL